MRIDEPTLDLPAEEGARMVALGLLDEASKAARVLAAGTGDEPLHDFRVSVRRLRSALRTFRPWLPDVRKRDRRRLRKLARSTNAARDAQVQLAWLGTLEARVSPSERAALPVVTSRLEARLQRGPDPARLTRRFRKAARPLARRLDRRGGSPEDGAGGFGAVLAGLVRDHAAALGERLAAIGGPEDQAGAHAARIAGKRLRYLLEPLRGLRGADASAAVARLKGLQDVLGELHDAHVLGDGLEPILEEVAVDRARQAHAAALASDAEARRLRARMGSSPRAGLLALVRRVRDRRDALHGTLEQDWRTKGLGALASEARALAAALALRGRTDGMHAAAAGNGAAASP